MAKNETEQDRWEKSGRLQGECPSCGSSSLFVGSGGYVTCGVIGCKDPGAAHDALKRRKVSPMTPETKDRLVKLIKAWRAPKSQFGESKYNKGWDSACESHAVALESIVAQMDETPAPAETVVIGEEHATGLGHLGRVVSSDEWFRPKDPTNFMLVCCDCGLTHRVEQRVVDGVAEFRWVNSPDDTIAHRHDERNDFPVFRAAAGLSTDPDAAPADAPATEPRDIDSSEWQNAQLQKERAELCRCGHSAGDHMSDGCHFITEESHHSVSLVYCDCQEFVAPVPAPPVAETEARQELHEIRSRLAREADAMEQKFADVDRRDWGHARAHALAVLKAHTATLRAMANGEVPVMCVNTSSRRQRLSASPCGNSTPARLEQSVMATLLSWTSTAYVAWAQAVR